MLIVARFKVRVVVDNLDHPHGILEPHVLLVVALVDNVLLAVPLDE
jgi:hypothetical protein